MTWIVYALRSLKDGGLYIGMTCNLARRLKEHNGGYNRSTRGRTPLELLYAEECASRQAARGREKFLKSGKGREMLKGLLSSQGVLPPLAIQGEKPGEPAS